MPLFRVGFRRAQGVIAFGSTLRECQNELRATLEDWLLLGFKLGHPLPEINAITASEWNNL